MGLILKEGSYGAPFGRAAGRRIVSETRLNRLALEYGYRYRLDVTAKNGLTRTEFVRTLSEARFVGIPVRRSGGTVRFFKIGEDGNVVRHQW